MSVWLGIKVSAPENIETVSRNNGRVEGGVLMWECWWDRAKKSVKELKRVERVCRWVLKGFWGEMVVGLARFICCLYVGAKIGGV